MRGEKRDKNMREGKKGEEQEEKKGLQGIVFVFVEGYAVDRNL